MSMPWETDFIVGQDDFNDLVINPTAQDSFYYFFSERDPESIKSIIKQLSEGVALSQDEVNELLQRKKRLKEFEHALAQWAPESHWQDFFERNKWIFGYGLNYVILTTKGHPYVGGKQVNQ